MGVNLVPKVEDIRVLPYTFRKDNKGNEFVKHCFEDGCVKEDGVHRLLTFAFICHNTGDTALNAGDPRTQPDIFKLSPGHDHYHLQDFNKYILRSNSTGEEILSHKQAFCLEDTRPLSWPEEEWPNLRSTFTNCNVLQGISAGWADVYSVGLPCQFIVLTSPSRSIDVKDGDYTLEVTTNPEQPEGPLARFDKHIFKEDEYRDNTLKIPLHISGNNITTT
jgi:hypothetical protein